MARKKIVFVIVEGPSDDEALGVILSKIFNSEEVHVEIMYGDITSDFSVNANNIAGKIGDTVKNYAKNYYLKKSDFQQVIHLIDMDGAFVSDDNIIEDSSAKKIIYSEENIITDNVDKVIKRNERKCENINRIFSMNKVWTSIPYRAYYMSANLDHVLYNKLNSTDNEKENDAHLFSKKYKEDIEGFLEYISHSDFSVCDNYKDSWEFIKYDNNSLKRYSNLGLCFVDTPR